MKFKKRVATEAGLRQFDIAPLIDCVFLLLIFFMLTSSFIVVPGINIKLPKTLTAEQIDTRALTIMISSEDIIYLDGKPVTLTELDGMTANDNYDSIFIKADKDSSLGVVVQVWDVCRRRGIERIGIATTHGD